MKEWNKAAREGKQAGVTLNKGQRLEDVMCTFTMFGLKTKRRFRRLGQAEPFIEENNVAKDTKLFAFAKEIKIFGYQCGTMAYFPNFLRDHQTDIEFVKTSLAGRKNTERRFRS